MNTTKLRYFTASQLSSDPRVVEARNVSSSIIKEGDESGRVTAQGVSGENPCLRRSRIFAADQKRATQHFYSSENSCKSTDW